MANVKNNAASYETKRRLIEAAGEVFAERGPERATIKEITDRAGASLAAVNYHFSDKRELYYQVVKHAHQSRCNAVQTLQETKGSLSAPERLRRFIRTMLTNGLNPSGPAWHGIVLAREMREPSAATERLIDETIRGYSNEVLALAEELVGKPTPRNKLILLANGIMAQCFFYADHRAFHERLFPDIPPATERIEELTEHITQFSLAAIRGLSEQYRAAL